MPGWTGWPAPGPGRLRPGQVVTGFNGLAFGLESVYGSLDMERTISLTVNGKRRELQLDDADTLLEVLRDRLKLWSVRESCGVGACGSCTVLLDGRPVSACFLLASRLDGRAVETVEGLGDGDALHPIQQAFLEHDAAQCGYCTPGFIMAAKALLEEHGDPAEDQIREHLSGNLCRCGGYPNIMRAVRAAAAQQG